MPTGSTGYEVAGTIDQMISSLTYFKKIYGGATPIYFEIPKTNFCRSIILSKPYLLQNAYLRSTMIYPMKYHYGVSKLLQSKAFVTRESPYPKGNPIGKGVVISFNHFRG